MARVLQFLGLSTLSMARVMNWNSEPIPYAMALRIGWNLPQDVVGAGVYGGIVKRQENGDIIVGDEWPEDNVQVPAHNQVHPTGPYLDFSKLTEKNRGYTAIAHVIMAGDVVQLEQMLEKAGKDASKLANLVMTGGARPLHMCGMSRGGDASKLVNALIAHGADVNAKDNYELTPVDRLASNSVAGNRLLREHGAVASSQISKGVPNWEDVEFNYNVVDGYGEVPNF